MTDVDPLNARFVVNSASKETMLEASYNTLNIITAEIHPTPPFGVESVKMEPSSETNVSATVGRRYEIISQEDVIRTGSRSRILRLLESLRAMDALWTVTP